MFYDLTQFCASLPGIEHWAHSLSWIPWNVSFIIYDRLSCELRWTLNIISIDSNSERIPMIKINRKKTRKVSDIAVRLPSPVITCESEITFRFSYLICVLWYYFIHSNLLVLLLWLWLLKAAPQNLYIFECIKIRQLKIRFFNV